LKLSVVILNYNVRYFLELCLKSVQEALKDIDAEIIVVDNNSSDESCQMVNDAFPEVILIQNDKNLGFSKGNNQGVKLAKGEYILILNPDTVVAEDSLKKLLEFADSKKNVGIVGCKLIDGSGKFLPESKRNIPTPKVSIRKIFGNSSSYYANHINENNTYKADILVGACMLLKKEMYQKVGGFDEDYFMYGEDIDLSFKILKLGYDNYFFGDTTILHFKGESTLKDKTYDKHFYNAMRIFYKKHFKKNMLFDVMVSLGLFFARVFKSNLQNETKQVDRYLLQSDKTWVKLSSKLNKPIIYNIPFSNVQDFTEIIFDANYLSYKDIINQMASIGKNKLVTFKILPKNSNFILGSNSNKSRGEVVIF